MKTFVITEEEKNDIINKYRSNTTKRLMLESGCGSGLQPPKIGSNIKIIYNEDTDLLEIDGMEYDPPNKLIDNQELVYGDKQDVLPHGEYECWGNVVGAAIVKNGKFTGYSAEGVQTLPGLTRCGGSFFSVANITISKDGSWVVSENNHGFKPSFEYYKLVNKSTKKSEGPVYKYTITDNSLINSQIPNDIIISPAPDIVLNGGIGQFKLGKSLYSVDFSKYISKSGKFFLLSENANALAKFNPDYEIKPNTQWVAFVDNKYNGDIIYVSKKGITVDSFIMKNK